MEEEGIGLVLARAIELRLKISNCIRTATTTPNGDADDYDETTQRLLNICSALEALETQLSSLQVLQQQQRYEREIALAEIENSRKMLTDKLKEYQGKELEVIHEASSFASERVESNNDLLLPPYPSRPPYSMRLDKEYQPHIPSVNKNDHNGLITHDPIIEAKKSTSEKEQNHVNDEGKNPRRGWGLFLARVSKTVVTVVGVVSILTLSGFGPNLGKVGILFNVQGLRQRTENEQEIPATENEVAIPITQCPPGRVLVMENGEARCLVKERIEIPFSAVAAIPDIYYGSG